MKVLTDLNMNNNEVKEVLIHKVSSDPVAVAKNQAMLIFNTTDKKLKYYNGNEWITIGTMNETVIDSLLSDSSTNSNAAGSKAVVEYVKTSISGLVAIKNEIDSVANGEVLRTNSSGAIVGIPIDETVTQDSTNLITSGAVYSALSSNLGDISTVLASVVEV